MQSVIERFDAELTKRASSFGDFVRIDGKTPTDARHVQVCGTAMYPPRKYRVTNV